MARIRREPHEVRARLARDRRDASIGRLTRITGAIAVGTVALVLGLGAYVSRALPGHHAATSSNTAPTTGPSTTAPNTTAPSTTAPSASVPSTVPTRGAPEHRAVGGGWVGVTSANDAADHGPAHYGPAHDRPSADEGAGPGHERRKLMAHQGAASARSCSADRG